MFKYPDKKIIFYWALLCCSILCEVGGTLFLKYSINRYPLLGLGLMYVMLAISYGLLAIAVKSIPLAVAYGAWESLGLILIAGFSTLFFAESMSRVKMLAIVLILIGMVLLNYGTRAARRKPS